MKMAVLKPFKRTARPQEGGKYLGSAHYIKDPRYADAPAHYIRAFQILLKDLLELFDYVEPADDNRGCYSFRIHELHTRACIEFEANCKAILFENGYPMKRNWNLVDYKKLEQTHRLSSFQVRLPVWLGNNNPRTPFEKWKTGHGLPWYKAYNDAKHSRHLNFDQSIFKTCSMRCVASSQY